MPYGCVKPVSYTHLDVYKRQIYAQGKVQSSFAKYLRIPTKRGYTGVQVARNLLDQHEMCIRDRDAELINISIKAMRIYMAASLLFGIQISCQQTFIALGNAKTSVFLAILRKIILLIPLIYILPLFLQNKVNAVFLAEPVADIIAVTITGIMFAIQFKTVLRELEA